MSQRSSQRNSTPRAQTEPSTGRLKPWMYALSAASLVMGVIVISVMISYYRFHHRPVLTAQKQVTLTIPNGTSWPGVKAILKRHRLVRSSLFFELWARERGLPPKVKAGVYTLKGPITLSEFDAILRRGGVRDGVKVIIPEGFTIFHIADRLESLNIISRVDFLSAARRPSLLSDLDIPGDSVEGYIFPDTYYIKRGTGAEAIIRRMHGQFESRWAAIVKKHPDALPALKKHYSFDKHDVVIMASIVERETNHNPERDTVARVFYNRLKKNMKLQTDPTCMYDETRYNKVPNPRDCKDPLNRYSTYVIKGLPPGPISVPGAASLEAALVPDPSPESRKWLFFVARRDGSGAHHFTSTFGEHRKAIKRYLLKKTSSKKKKPRKK